MKTLLNIIQSLAITILLVILLFNAIVFVTLRIEDAIHIFISNDTSSVYLRVCIILVFIIIYNNHEKD